MASVAPRYPTSRTAWTPSPTPADNPPSARKLVRGPTSPIAPFRKTTGAANCDSMRSFITPHQSRETSRLTPIAVPCAP
ncbi:MAG: hypothetical protein BWZ02_03234 [Lentisphaerae bacterium ADurb.BinA184]|nr:MAG: hypothetical protein BWZ02_03234 [Lentisphaerae bacterium ADurb.BinA184]